jgi:hypothetical protein
MTDPIITDREHMLEPVHADEDEHPRDKWTWRLVFFMRAVALIAMLKGLYHWAVICGLDAPGPAGFEEHVMPYKAATVFFAVIDLVAAVGLWLAAPWGAVVWLTSAISMAAVEILFPQVFGGRMWVAAIEGVLLIAYLVLAVMAAREQPA